MSVSLVKGYHFTGYIDGEPAIETDHPVTYDALVKHLLKDTLCMNGRCTGDYCPREEFLTGLVRDGMAFTTICHPYNESVTVGFLAVRVPGQGRVWSD